MVAIFYRRCQLLVSAAKWVAARFCSRHNSIHLVLYVIVAFSRMIMTLTDCCEGCTVLPSTLETVGL